jgi:hypothetical protein
VAARTRYQEALRAVREPRFQLPNTDFDTGAAPAAGRNRLADKTYADLLHKLAERDFAGVPEPLERQLASYFGAGGQPSSRSGSPGFGPRVVREVAQLSSRQARAAHR